MLHKSRFMQFVCAGMMLLSMGCAKINQFEAGSFENGGLVSLPSTDPNTAAGGATPAPQNGNYKMSPLVWESSSTPERTQWSSFLQKILLEDWKDLLAGSSDITSFCPGYYGLNTNQRANVWAQIFAAISKYESGFSPVSRMQETTMGTDPITGRAVYSEGLLQLSYQDVQWAPWCAFDWNQDQSLSATSIQKTILNPYNNLHCGVGIMADQIQRKGAIVLSSGVYWAVLKSGGKYQQIAGIQALVKNFSLCK